MSSPFVAFPIPTQDYSQFYNIFNVKSFGAVGDGVHDDTSAIQAAINLGLSTGGAIIHFPAGNYLVSSPLTFTSVATKPGVVLRGVSSSAGLGSIIQGNFSDFIIKKPDDSQQTLMGIEKLTIINNSTNSASGAILMNFTINVYVRDCFIGGFIGVRADSNCFDGLIQNCGFYGPGNITGSIGAMIGQVTVHNCRLAGWDNAVRMFNASASVIGCALEVNNTAIMVGQDITGANNQLSGGAIISNSTERNNTAIYIYSAAGIIVSGNTITGTVDVRGEQPVSTITWSAGTVTVTTSSPHGLVGTRKLVLNNQTPSGYSGYFTCTITGASTFTYPLVSNPGVATVPGFWSNSVQYGIRVKNSQGVLYSGNSLGLEAEFGAIDLAADGGSTAGAYNVFVGNIVNLGNSFWVMPPSASKSGFTFIGNNNPAHILAFVELPGQANSLYVTPALEGMEYDINNSNTAVWGATAAGGGSNHVKVRYNGTNWTVMGA